MTTHLKFYWHRLRSLRERLVDRLFRIDERCEGCRRPLVIDGLRREPYVVDGDGCSLCDPCAASLQAA